MITTRGFGTHIGRALMVTGLCLSAVLPASTASATTQHQQRRAATTSAARADVAIPDSARHTLELIDAGHWPPADSPGTKGGARYGNASGLLPTTDAAGELITYRVWDADAKKPGRPRSADRIVTGNDGSAWYSPDTCRTFARMR